MKTVHLIFNAHLDPVWLWPWSAGLDEIINTASSVCDLLDRHPDLVFTRGESWVYAQMERMAPALFRRVVRHVKSGQWEVVGGWYIQPDCNLPGRKGFERQIKRGKDYFLSRFGAFPRIAYNVDSFGHAASLPDIMRAHGQTHYVMMRPQAHEMTLPACLFRWQGSGGAEVATFRIAPAYCTATLGWDHIEGSLAGLPAGVDDTMCFVGVGDHGGGPTESLVEWCRENARRRPDVRLVFSSPRRFFRAVDGTQAKWPLVKGELQHHAIGCYSAHREVKRLVKTAEELLTQADAAVATDRSLRTTTAAARQQAWDWACFGAFHDTIGGTCLPSAYPQVNWQLGHALCTADEILQVRLRRLMAGLPRDPLQRIVLGNFGATDFDDYLEHEPWLEWTEWQPDWVLLDERGRVVPHQRMDGEAMRSNMARVLFRISVPAGKTRVLRIARKPGASVAPVRRFSSLKIGRAGLLAARDARGRCPLPRLQLRVDRTDAWSHGVDRFDDRIVDHATWRKPQRMETGPLVECWQVAGRIGRSPLKAEWRFYARAPFIDLHLRVEWREEHRILQLVHPTGSPVVDHVDGIPGDSFQRAADGKERPIRDFVLLRLAGGDRAGLVCPEVFSASVERGGATLTLLRSCIMTHHVPYDARRARRRFSDRGEHEIRFRFYRGAQTDVPTLEAAARALESTVLRGDLTVGMPLRPLRGQASPGLAPAQKK